MKSRPRHAAADHDPEGNPAGILRASIVIVIALLAAAEVARITIAADYADDNPAFATRLAPSSPSALIASAMTEVGTAAANGQDVGRLTLQRLRSAADRAPLSPEPYLVQAAIAERAGQLSRAQSLLETARWLDPRSAAARYLLADVWLRQGKIVDGLREMAALSRIMPDTAVQLVPALADFARSPGASKQLAGILQSNPELRRPLLTALAANPHNAGLALELAGPELRSTDPASQSWKSHLLAGMVQHGQYDQAYSVWRNFAGNAPASPTLVFNGDFRPSPAPPPFNWAYGSGIGGIADPGNGRLRILFYGKAGQTLAAQLLLLKPGAYRFNAPVNGDASAGALGWSLTCAGNGRAIMQLPVGTGGSSTTFSVPEGCAAQSLQLKGSVQDMPEDSNVEIGPVSIEKATS